MTDLEMTRLCAEARGLQHHAPRGGMDDDLWAIDYSSDDVPYSFRYDPLHDNAQAMALVKKLRLTVLGSGGYPEYEGWQGRGVL